MIKNKVKYLIISTLFLYSCSNISSNINYVLNASATSPIMVYGTLNNENVDYILSSEPYITKAENLNSNLFRFENMSKSFTKKFNSNGFPQAGLFIRNNIDNGQLSQSIKSFVSKIDHNISLLSNNNCDNNLFNIENTLFESILETNKEITNEIICRNGFSYVSQNEMPTFDSLSKLENPLKFKFNSEMFSKFYKVPFIEQENQEINGITISCPKGAPSLCLINLVENTSSISFSTPNDIRNEFSKKESDLIIFDTITGLKLSKNNNNSYHLLRVITNGNLYLMSTNHDTNNTVDKNDKIVLFSEGMVPDLVFKSLYEI